jgi:adhesin transport system outer membrane protein
MTPVLAMDLPDLVADTLSAHPQVKEKVHGYRRVLSDQDLATSGNRPSVDLQASTGLYNTESPSTGNSSVDYDSSRVELSVTQNLFNGYQTTNEIRQNEARARAALYDLFDTADNIALDTVQAYLEALKQKRLYELARQNVKSHEGILAQIRERHSSGVGRASQLQQTEGRVARAHASLIAQQNNLRDSLSQLHHLLGRYVDVDTFVEPILPELPPGDLDTQIETALKTHPAMVLASNNIDATRYEYQRSLSTRYPNLDLRLASEWGKDIDGVAGDTEEVSLVLNLTYNFYNGGADKAGQQNKVSAMYEQKEFGARIRRQIINTLRLAWVADESLSRQIEFLQQHIDKAEETVSSYREEFFIGQRDLIDLLDAENELNSARNEHTNAYFDLMAARYRVFEAIGSLFPALQLESSIDDDDFTVARIQANERDALPLPEDEDQDKQTDNADHCDNTLTGNPVNAYGCETLPEVEFGFMQVNSAPDVVDDRFVVDSHGLLVISRARLLENDSDKDGDPISIVDFGSPENGRMAFDANKNLVYRPAEEFAGTDTFSYTVSDGNGTASTGMVYLDVEKNDRVDLTKMQLVNFKYNSTEMTDSSNDKVQAIIRQVKLAEDVGISITTHTDSSGSDAYNQKLSERRANALLNVLIEAGIDASTITARGMGESQPIADNSDEQGRGINRRGEFTFELGKLAQ